MGHNRLQIQPKTRHWREVVDVLEDLGSRTAEIASATAIAARIGLQRAKGDKGLSSEESEKYQKCASRVARRKGLTRACLDITLWRPENTGEIK